MIPTAFAVLVRASLSSALGLAAVVDEHMIVTHEVSVEALVQPARLQRPSEM
jgi:hypothetical protein